MDFPHEDKTLIFEPEVNPSWTEGLELCDKLIRVSKGSKKPSITVSVQNPTAHEIVLAGRSVIGTVQQIQAIYPATTLEGPRPLSPATTNHIRTEKDKATGKVWDPPLDLSHLNESEREIVSKMLREEDLLFENR